MRNKAKNKIESKPLTIPIELEDIDEDEYGCEAPRIPRQKAVSQKIVEHEPLEIQTENDLA